MTDILNSDNVRDFDAALDLGSYDCEACGYNYDQLQAAVDNYGNFILTNHVGCFNWGIKIVTEPQDAEETLRDWASWRLQQGHLTQVELDEFVIKVRKALDIFNSVTT